MTGPAGDGRPVLGRDDLLIAAWTAWERTPGAAWTAAAKTDALLACGLDVIGAHERIATARRAGMSVPDAIQTCINDHHQEAA